MNRREFLVQLAALVGAAAIPTLPQIISQKSYIGAINPEEVRYLDRDKWVSLGNVGRLDLISDILDTSNGAESFSTSKGWELLRLPDKTFELNVTIEMLNKQMLSALLYGASFEEAEWIR